MDPPNRLQLADFPFNIIIRDRLRLEDGSSNNNNGDNNNGNANNGASTSTTAPTFVTPWCLPDSKGIGYFERWFNQSTFSDLRFVSRQTGEVIHVHKVMLSRAVPMRNFLLLQGDTFNTVFIPPGARFPQIARFLQALYYDGDAVNVGRLKLEPAELAFLEELFGRADQLGFIPCKPLKEHISSLMGARRFSDGIWIKKTGPPVPIHRILLSVHSEYFLRAFENGLQETHSKKVHLPDVSDEMGKLLLQFLYLDPHPAYLDPEVVLEMLYFADRFQVGELRQLCIEEIARGVQDGSVDTENVLLVLEAAMALNIPELREACLRLAVTNFLELQEREDFITLSPDLKTELTMLTRLQNNPLRSRTIARSREIVAILKESLEGQQASLEHARAEFDNARTHPIEEGEEEVKPEILAGRQTFVRHWEQLIAAQERRVAALRNYLLNHEAMFG